MLQATEIECLKCCDGYWGDGFKEFLLNRGDASLEWHTFVKVGLYKTRDRDTWIISVTGRAPEIVGEGHLGFHYQTQEGFLSWIEAVTVYVKIMSESTINKQFLLNLGFKDPRI
jgi:hypothetical protein